MALAPAVVAGVAGVRTQIANASRHAARGAPRNSGLVSGQPSLMKVGVRLLQGTASFVFVLAAMKLHVLAIDTRSWPSTIGHLDSRGVSYGSGSDGGVGVTGDSAIYARYSYQVAGKHYVGSRVKMWDMLLTKPGITPGSLDPSRAGGRVTVFYN